MMWGFMGLYFLSILILDVFFLTNTLKEWNEWDETGKILYFLTNSHLTSEIIIHSR